MEESKVDLLTDSFLELNTVKRGRLLPWWVKIFAWIFLILGIAAPIGFIYSLIAGDFTVSIYGFQTSDTTSIFGICITIIFLFKGMVSFGLITKKNWAIKWAIADAIIGIILCLTATAYPLIFPDSGGGFTFRGEIILLIPYLIKMNKIKLDWERADR